ncbi:MAG: pdxT [Acidimicrobiales bacterium]|nr:pdxT [Acidimicrobiales bacterium]
MPGGRRPLVGVLALQGAFAAHQRALESCAADTRQVRLPDDLDGLDGLVMPGGESTTMSRLLTTSGLFEPIGERIEDGLAVFGTCAGMILLARDVLDGRPDQRSFAAIDIAVRRNGYGRQIDSFEADIDVPGTDREAGIGTVPFHAVFIRAPKVESVGPSVTVLAEHDGVPVLARSGRMFVASFHPELTPDHRLHSLFLQEV